MPTQWFSHRASLVLLLACSTHAFAGSPPAVGPDTSSIVIVGTVHRATEHYDVQTLCRIIERVKPDLILVELDSSFFTSSMTLKPEYVDVSMENKAVALSLQDHAIPIRPYDIEGRNKIYEQHGFFKLQRDLSAALNSAEKDSLLSNEASLFLDAIVRFDRIGAEFGSERPEVINSQACDAAMESKQYYAGEGMVRIITSVPVLARFADIARFRRDFWIARNDAMVNNIIASVKTFPGKTALVLCGYEHRYYLREALEERAKNGGFVVREFWSY